MDIVNQKFENNYSEKDHCEFRYQWLIIMLCRELLPRKDMLAFLKYFNIKFLGDDWENNVSVEEIGWTIEGDIEKGELLPYLQNYLKKNYSKLFTFEEAEKIYNTLLNIDNEITITKLWLSMACDCKYTVIMEDRLKYYEELKQKGKFNEHPTIEEKLSYNSDFKDMMSEIVISLYKLAMKNYK